MLNVEDFWKGFIIGFGIFAFFGLLSKDKALKMLKLTDKDIDEEFPPLDYEEEGIKGDVKRVRDTFNEDLKQKNMKVVYGSK